MSAVSSVTKEQPKLEAIKVFNFHSDTREIGFQAMSIKIFAKGTQEESEPQIKDEEGQGSMLDLIETLQLVQTYKFGVLGQQSLATEKFELFPRFPLELRLKIWSDVMPGPRVLTMCHSPKAEHLICRTLVPANLHVCRESRNEALKRFKVLFDPKKLIGTSTPPIVYINPETDSVYYSTDQLEELAQDAGYATRYDLPALSDSGDFEDLWRNSALEIKHLVLDSTALIPNLAQVGSMRILRELENFRSLEKITLISTQPEDGMPFQINHDGELSIPEVDEYSNAKYGGMMSGIFNTYRQLHSIIEGESKRRVARFVGNEKGSTWKGLVIEHRLRII